MRLADKVALVVGGTRGIGRGVVECFCREGAIAVFAGRDPETGEALQRTIQAGGGRGEYVRCDALNLGQLRQVINDAAALHGKLDILVNSAGVALKRPLLDSSEEDYERLFDLNVRATYFAMKWAAEIMVDAAAGSIINITSAATARGFANRTLYSGTKAAVLQMSRVAALELAPHHIRVNCISPGTVDTDLLRNLYFAGQPDQDHLIERLGAEQPLGRVGSIYEIGAAAVYFASSEAEWVTGANLNIDGGIAI